MPCVEYCEPTDNLEEKLNKVTDMLCRLLTNENYGVIETRIPDDIQEWWEKHKEWDAKRKENKQ